VNRSMVAVATGMILAAFALITYPLWALGLEQFDLEQELGILFLPFGLVIMLVAFTSIDPLTTTVGGPFGNPEFDRGAAGNPTLEPRPRRPYHPNEPVRCAKCRTFLTADLTQCPRCSLARPCRTCSRPLGLVLERATCPTCARAEPFCNCPALAPTGPRSARERIRARR
jgi:hypothetical protein